jgi:hypothetical protein
MLLLGERQTWRGTAGCWVGRRAFGCRVPLTDADLLATRCTKGRCSMRNVSTDRSLGIRHGPDRYLIILEVHGYRP